MFLLKRKADGLRDGFTLIEILIAIMISSVAMLALLGVFEYQQRVYNDQTELARTQANLRSAMQYIARDVRMAGFTGLPLRTLPKCHLPKWPVV